MFFFSTIESLKKVVMVKKIIFESIGIKIIFESIGIKIIYE